MARRCVAAPGDRALWRSALFQVPAADRNALSSLWGKLASEILMQNWEAAMEDLGRLRETVDNNVSTGPCHLTLQAGFLT